MGIIEFIFNKRERSIFLGALVASATARIFRVVIGWIIIQIENDFSQSILAKAGIRSDYYPPAKAFFNIKHKYYLMLNALVVAHTVAPSRACPFFWHCPKEGKRLALRPSATQNHGCG
jgi:hypothetical protein